MTTRVASHLSTAACAGAELAHALSERLGATPALVLVFASPSRDLAALLPQVQAALPAAVVLGATTAGEFTEGGDAKGSVSVFGLAGDFVVRAGLGTGLRDDLEGAVERALGALPAPVEGYPHRTALLLCDALAGHGEETALLAATMLGQNVRLVGGAAGDDLQMQRTLVGLGARVEADAVVLAEILSRQPVGLGVCHGHAPISAPMRVTRASGARVFEVDGKPAWGVWQDHTREAARRLGIDVDGLPPDEVGAFLVRFEAGMPAGQSYKIRAPLQRLEDGSLQFACELPEGAEFRITESVPERQIDSAREAARRARAQLGGATPAGALVFDCICRKLILGERFVEAVQAMGQELGGAPLAGFETYGEIALDEGDLSGFHNTTTVVLAFA